MPNKTKSAFQATGAPDETSRRDLSGQTFGHLTAVAPTEQRKGGFVVWECKCDCGNTAYVPSGSLLSGNTKSCGKCQARNSTPKPKILAHYHYSEKTMPGQRFGRLVALKLDSIRYSDSFIPMRVPYWLFHCDCGKELVLNAYAVMNGKITSCGCVPNKGLPSKKILEITGQKFNHLTAIRFDHKDSAGNACWLFRCDCGKECVLPAAQVIRGNTKSCGHLRYAPRTLKQSAKKSDLPTEKQKRKIQITWLAAQSARRKNRRRRQRLKTEDK